MNCTWTELDGAFHTSCGFTTSKTDDKIIWYETCPYCGREIQWGEDESIETATELLEELVEAGARVNVAVGSAQAGVSATLEICFDDGCVDIEFNDITSSEFVESVRQTLNEQNDFPWGDACEE